MYLFKDFLKKNILYINFFTSISVFGFQTTVLYPCHNELNKKIDIISKDIKKLNIS